MTIARAFSKLGVFIAAAGFVAVASGGSASAQMVRFDPAYEITPGPYFHRDVLGAYGWDDYAPVPGSGLVAAPFRVQTPTQCWTDEGYGRIASCDVANR